MRKLLLTILIFLAFCAGASNASAATITLKATGNWNATGTWSPAQIPTAVDDVVLTGSYTVTIPANYTALCRSLNATGFTGKLDQSALPATLNIGDPAGTVPASNIALKFVTGMTYSLNGSTPQADGLNFVGTSSTMQTIDVGGKTTGPITISGAGSNYALISGITVTSGGGFVWNAGTLHTDGTADNLGLTHSFASFSSSGTTTRALYLGNSTINASAWTITNTTGMTLNYGTATLNVTGTVDNGSTTGGLTYGTINFPSITTAGLKSGTTASYGNIVVTGAASNSAAFTFNDSNANITGTLTLNGISSQYRLLVISNIYGTPATVTTANISSNYADFQDIHASSTWNLTAQSAGDCGGNTNISFPLPSNQTATMSTDHLWSDAIWSGHIPLPQDTALLSGVTGGTLTINMPRIGSINCSSSSSGTLTNNLAFNIYGSLNLTDITTFTATNSWNFTGRNATYTIRSNGKSFAVPVVINTPDGTYNLADGFSGITLTNTLGTFGAVSSPVTLSTGVTLTAGTLNMGSNIWTISGASTKFTYTAGTLNAQTSTILLTDTGAAAKTFNGGGKTFYNLQFYGTGAGAITINGNNTFNSIKEEPSHLGTKTLNFAASSTTTIVNGTGFGNGTNLITVNSLSAGTPFIFKKSSAGRIAWNYVSLKDCTATPVAGVMYFAGRNSTSVSGNSANWIWANPPTNMILF